MGRKSKHRSNDTTKLINKTFESLTFLEEQIKNQLYILFNEYVDYDIKNIRECHEMSISEYYIEGLYKYIIDPLMMDETAISDIIDMDNLEDGIEDIMNTIRIYARNMLANTYAPDVPFDDTIDKYFNDVKREYIKHPMKESENYDMTDENRDIFIKNNLKTVIECAKRYRNMGLDFADLIQIGNMGLLKAWDRFDTTKSDLQDSIIENINAFNKDNFTFEEAKYIITQNFKYPKLLPQTIDKLPKEGFNTHEEFIEWTKNNIKKASFASLGFIWARAAITSELNALSNIIRVPKAVRSGDEKVTFINLDSLNPHTGDNFNDDEIYEISDEAFVEDDDNIENMERKDMFKKIVNETLYKLDPLTRRIISKRFGINLPYQLSIADIAMNEGLSQREVKSSIEQGLAKIGENISEDNRKILIELL